jgi:hypothetical protein
MIRAARTNYRGRRRVHPNMRQVGHEREDHFFAIVERHRSKLPSNIARIERAEKHLDHRGADGIVFFHDKTRLYFDTKATEGAMEEHDRLGSSVPAFLIIHSERDNTAWMRFLEFVKKEHEKILGRVAHTTPVWHMQAAAAPA